MKTTGNNQPFTGVLTDSHTKESEYYVNGLSVFHLNLETFKEDFDDTLSEEDRDFYFNEIIKDNI